MSHTYIPKFLKFKGFQICSYVFFSVNGCSVINNYMIFHKIKVTKHILDPCCYLVAETGSWFPLVATVVVVLMDKLYLTGQTLGRVFNSRSGCMSCHAPTAQFSNTTNLRVKNSAQTTLRFSPVIYHTPHCICLDYFGWWDKMDQHL